MLTPKKVACQFLEIVCPEQITTNEHKKLGLHAATIFIAAIATNLDDEGKEILINMVANAIRKA